MPGYRRRYNRKIRRSNKKKRTFSRLNTYKHRSSKQQAYQIYKLNKKINYVYKMTKPETQIYQPTTAVIDNQLYSTSTNGRSIEMHRCIDQSLDIFDGRYARIKNVQFTGSFNWDGNPDSSPQDCVGCLRLIFFRPVKQQWSIPSINDVLPYNATEFSNEYFIKCPLKYGFSTKFKLVADYKFYLYPQKSSTRFINIKLKYPYSLRRSDPLSSDVSPTNAFPVNSLFCVSYLCRSHHYNVLDTFSCELFMKLAFTDDKFSQPDTRDIATQPDTNKNTQPDSDPDTK